MHHEHLFAERVCVVVVVLCVCRNEGRKNFVFWSDRRVDRVLFSSICSVELCSREKEKERECIDDNDNAGNAIHVHIGNDLYKMIDAFLFNFFVLLLLVPFAPLSSATHEFGSIFFLFFSLYMRCCLFSPFWHFIIFASCASCTFWYFCEMGTST